MIPVPSAPSLLEGRPLVTRCLQRAVPWLIGALVIVLYLPSIPGDFLAYDDPWLVENNPILKFPLGAALRSIFFDLDFYTRFSLGAEYLPLRDVSYWIDRALGLGAPAMRAEQVFIYIAAVLLVRAALLLNLRSRIAAEVVTLCFALHPVHVESVAWIAGRKDVLALFFIAAALRAYEAPGRRSWAAVPLLVLAYFSKSMSIVACGLLLAQDLIARRRPRWGVLSVSALLAVLSLQLHGMVGARVSMLSGPLAGDRATAWRTMGHVWLRYLQVLAWPPKLALMHEVPRPVTWDAASLLGWGLIAAGALAGVLWLRRGKPLVLACWLWTVVPLVPVSQVLVPLQNVMADRYLWLSVFGVGLLLARLWQLGRLGAWGVLVALGVWATGSAWRADSFADGVALFSREIPLTRGAAAPVALAEAYVRRLNLDSAER
ncbi:MAG TPA: hypothetical protein VG963_11135, partial [Polyangiaceae bacterium]|nr:hypothetical protein [Polyangiaceae bacterium]